KVGRDGFVMWQGSAYGVPWCYAGQEVQIQATEDRVEIWAGMDRIAVHPRAHAPGQRFVLPGQWEGIETVPARRPREAVIRAVPDVNVEVRPLAVYEHLVGGVGLTRSRGRKAGGAEVQTGVHRRSDDRVDAGPGHSLLSLSGGVALNPCSTLQKSHELLHQVVAFLGLAFHEALQSGILALACEFPVHRGRSGRLPVGRR